MTTRLTGTAPHQTPTNADLGTMAYHDYNTLQDTFVTPRPNLLINGDFQVWQKGNNIQTGGNTTNSMWKMTRGRIRAPNTSSNGFNHSGEDERGAVFDVTDGGVYQHFDTYIESHDNANLNGKRVILSFEAKSLQSENSSNEFGLYVETGGTDRVELDSGNTTLTITNYWQKFSLPGYIIDVSSGAHYIHLPRWYVNPTGTSGYGGRMMQIDKVKLEIVDKNTQIATPFVSRTYAQELHECQRYFQRYFPTTQTWIYNESSTNTHKWFHIVFPQTMYRAPDLYATSNIIGGTIGQLGTVSGITRQGASVNAMSLRVTFNQSLGSSNAIYHIDSWGNNGGYFDLDASLT